MMICGDFRGSKPFSETFLNMFYYIPDKVQASAEQNLYKGVAALRDLFRENNPTFPFLYQYVV